MRVHDGRAGRLLHTFADESTDGSFGQVLFGPGDLDGDGCAEIVVTAPGARGKHAQPCRLHVDDGRTGTLRAVPLGDQDRDGWPDLGVAVVGRLRNCHLLRITHFRVAAEGR